MNDTRTGIFGFFGTGAGLLASIKAATELLQFFSALFAFAVGAYTAYKLFWPKIRRWFGCALVLCLAFGLTGCTSAIRSEYYPTGKLKSRTAYNSLGTQKEIKSLRYGDLEIHGLISDEAKGAEAFSRGAAQGISGNPFGGVLLTDPEPAIQLSTNIWFR